MELVRRSTRRGPAWSDLRRLDRRRRRRPGRGARPGCGHGDDGDAPCSAGRERPPQPGAARAPTDGCRRSTPATAARSSSSGSARASRGGDLSSASGPTRRAHAGTRIRIPSSCAPRGDRIHLFWRGGDWNPTSRRPPTASPGHRLGPSSACPASVPTSRWPPTAWRRSTSRSPTGTLARRRLACTTHATPPARGPGGRSPHRQLALHPGRRGPGLGRHAHRSARLGPRRRLRRGGGPAHRLRGLPLADRPPLPPRAVDGHGMATPSGHAGGRHVPRGRPGAGVLRRHRLRPRGPSRPVPVAAGEGSVGDRALADAGRRHVVDPPGADGGLGPRRTSGRCRRGGGPLWLRGPYVNYRRYRTVVVTD